MSREGQSSKTLSFPPEFRGFFLSFFWLFSTKKVLKTQSVILVGQKSVNYYIEAVVVALLSVVLVGFVILVTVILVVNCI